MIFFRGQTYLLSKLRRGVYSYFFGELAGRQEKEEPTTWASKPTTTQAKSKSSKPGCLGGVFFWGITINHRDIFLIGDTKACLGGVLFFVGITLR